MISGTRTSPSFTANARRLSSPPMRRSRTTVSERSAGGSKRGETLLFLIETEGLRIVHLGDLGCALNREQLSILKNPDVLMIPVGGFYTIDAETAQKTAEQLNARIILPMHYKTEYNREWPISGPETFTTLFDPGAICSGAEALRIAKKDMECQPRIVLFK